jgi:cytochrome c553
MITKLLMPVLVLSLFSAAQATAQDISAGKTAYQKDCRNCHGPTAKGMSVFPKLAGNSAEYIEKRLKQYRAGETVGPNTPLMAPLAKDLTDDDISNLAAYIATTFH